MEKNPVEGDKMQWDRKTTEKAKSGSLEKGYVTKKGSTGGKGLTCPGHKGKKNRPIFEKNSEILDRRGSTGRCVALPVR